MFILGKKGKMGQLWQSGKVVPVTVIQAAPNTVSIVRTLEKDGYSAVQVQSNRKKKEFRTAATELQKGDTVAVSVFNEGDIVDISGMMKGRGFQGPVKRHGFAGGPKTHGQKNRHRAGGSLGSTAPQRVVPGRRMAGHMGATRVTVKNLKVVAVDAEKNQISVRGAVPGFRGAWLEVRKVKNVKVKM